MSDSISIRDIRAWGRGGINPGEDAVPQPFDIDVQLEADLERCAHTDSIEDTIDYVWVHRMVVDTVAGTEFGLIERLAQEIARQILHERRISAVTVTIAKPGILSGATPSVSITRRR
ncbi:MAG: dihydroneopterin aldolase [Vulcanimicrobiaceae bacterium]